MLAECRLGPLGKQRFLPIDLRFLDQNSIPSQHEKPGPLHGKTSFLAGAAGFLQGIFADFRLNGPLGKISASMAGPARALLLFLRELQLRRESPVQRSWRL